MTAPVFSPFGVNPPISYSRRLYSNDSGQKAKYQGGIRLPMENIAVLSSSFSSNTLPVFINVPLYLTFVYCCEIVIPRDVDTILYSNEYTISVLFIFYHIT